MGDIMEWPGQLQVLVLLDVLFEPIICLPLVWMLIHVIILLGLRWSLVYLQVLRFFLGCIYYLYVVLIGMVALLGLMVSYDYLRLVVLLVSPFPIMQLI